MRPLCLGHLACFSLPFTRKAFLSRVLSSRSLFEVLDQRPISSQKKSSVVIDLLPLPVAGCLAIKIDLNSDVFRYYATVDTGSPFLTAPPSSADSSISKDVSWLFPPTNEQYGETVGTIKWRKTCITLRGYCDEDDDNGECELLSGQPIVVGIIPTSLMDDTGGLFCGLMKGDEARPTFMEQMGYNSFVLDWISLQMTLDTKALLSPRSRAAAAAAGIAGADAKSVLLENKNAGASARPPTPVLPLYSLEPFGPNLHHYAVQCQQVTFKIAAIGDSDNRKNIITMSQDQLSRPVVVVLDSGLTGCILSDSWKEDFEAVNLRIEDIQGAQIQIQDQISLESQPRYWDLSCFRLPWFYTERNHPHILAAGATFLRGCKLTVDTISQKVMIETTPSAG